MKNDINAVAEYLWTSNNSHEVVNNMELCSVCVSVRVRVTVRIRVRVSVRVRVRIRISFF